MSWFDKKPPHKKSPGGSTIHRYSGDESAGPRIGFTGESTAGFSEAREKIYNEFFGEALNVSHEVIPLIPHIDVYTYQPGHNDRDFFTLVTGGMSDLEMTLPAGAAGAPRRVEFIFYCS